MTVPQFGTYRVSYEPPADASEPEIVVNMSISCDATLNQMISLFEAFLLANGYQLPENHELGLREKPITVGWPNHPNVINIDDVLRNSPFNNED